MSSAMRAASQLPGRPLLWILLLYLHANQKSVVDDDDSLTEFIFQNGRIKVTAAIFRKTLSLFQPFIYKLILT